MAVAQQVSIEEFERMTPPDDARLELVDGEVVRLTFPTAFHNWIAKLVAEKLDEVVVPKGLGLVLGAPSGFVLSIDPPNLRGPDVVFLSNRRLAETDLKTNIRGAPDLAVEIISPNDRAIEVRKKVDQYLAAGAQAVWVLYPETLEVEISEPGRGRRILAADDILEAPELLPGFRLAVRELFPPDPR